MHFFQKLIMWASGYDYTSYSKTFLVLKLFSRCYTAIAQRPYTIQRKFQKNTKENFEFSFFQILGR